MSDTIIINTPDRLPEPEGAEAVGWVVAYKMLSIALVVLALIVAGFVLFDEQNVPVHVRTCNYWPDGSLTYADTSSMTAEEAINHCEKEKKAHAAAQEKEEAHFKAWCATQEPSSLSYDDYKRCNPIE